VGNAISQVGKSLELVQAMVMQKTRADETTHALSEAVGQISGILEVIHTIAGQIKKQSLKTFKLIF
jgi:methyl-accepting chemotaxis protein